MRVDVMRWLIVSLIWTLSAIGGFGQALPFHADPAAREELPDLSLVPAIRFLTTADFPPFNYRDGDGELIGFHIDLAEAICATLDITCTMQAWPWEQSVDALVDNQGDALIAGLAVSNITAEQLDFSNLYLMLPGRFVTLADAIGSFDIIGLAGQKVSVRAKSAHAAFLSAYFPEVEQVPFDTEIGALEALQKGEVVAQFGDALRASFWLNEHPACCGFAGSAYFNSRYFGEGFAVAVPAGRGALRNAINYALVRLKRDGKLDELYLRWFPVSFY